MTTVTATTVTATTRETLEHATADASSRRLRVRARAVAAGTAVLANSALFLATHAAGVDYKIADPGKEQDAHQFIVPEIAVFSLIFALLGWGTLALLERYTRRARAIWSALAVIVLVASFVPIGIEVATGSTKVMLGVIHAVVAVALFPMLRHTPKR